MTKSVKYGNIIQVALLIAGSATFLFSCSGGDGGQQGDRDEGQVTQQSDTLTIIRTKNGDKNYRFETPLLEQYDFATEPYREFRRGIYVETYNDSTGVIESTLIADYAIEFINQKLWEAKGNVKATNAQGHILETQQLFWNQRTEKVYSNIDSKVTQGDDVLVGVGFASHERFEVWEFRRPRGKLRVNVEPNRDTTSVRERSDETATTESAASSQTARVTPAAPANNSRSTTVTGSGISSPSSSGNRVQPASTTRGDFTPGTPPSPRERRGLRGGSELRETRMSDIMAEPLPDKEE